MGKYHVEYIIRSSLFFDAADYIVSIRGVIVHTDSDGARSEAGSIEVYKLDISRVIQDDIDLYGMMAYKHDEILDALDRIYTDDRLTKYNDAVEEFLGDSDATRDGIIIITSVDAVAEYRNHHIELAAIYRAIRTHYHGCRAVVLAAAQLRQTVLDYCHLLGFKQILDSKYWIYSTANQSMELISLFADELSRIDPDL